MGNSYLYERIYEFILQEIKEERYKPGDKIPSELELAAQFGVSRITSKKALDMLVLKHVIIRKAGKGSYVTDSISEQTALKDSLWHGGAPVRQNELQERDIQKKDTFIGLILPSFDSAYGAKIVLSIEEEATKNGDFLIIRRTLSDKENEKRAIEELLRIGVDALIIFPVASVYFSASILKLAVDKFNFVLIDRRLKDVPCISVSTNNRAAGKEVVNFLFDRNHRNIAIVALDQIMVTAVEERMEGFRLAYGERNFIFEDKYILNSLMGAKDKNKKCTSIDEDIELIKNHLTQYPEISAMIAIDYHIALLCQKAIKEMGLKKKLDISIICFDSTDDEYIDIPRFTHIQQHEEEIGRIAYNKVKSQFTSQVEYEDIQVDFTLVVGDSTN